MKHEIGCRVGAVSSGDEKNLRLFGYGIYDGDHTPEPSEGVTFMGMAMDHENPRITLDNGKHVYGCECWWGPEETVKKWESGREVVVLDIEAERAAARQSRGE